MLERDIEEMFRDHALHIVRQERLIEQAKSDGAIKRYLGVIDGLKLAMMRELYQLYGTRRDVEWFYNQIQDAIVDARKKT